MTRKPSTVSRLGRKPIRVVIVTLDTHLSIAVARVQEMLSAELPTLVLSMHAASEWNGNPGALEHCINDIEQADVIVANMLFMEEHINAVRDALRTRRTKCSALVCCMAEPGISKLTKMGSLDMCRPEGVGLSWLKKLRGRGGDKKQSAGQAQMAALKRLPQFLRFLPGTAQDLRLYFLTMQYWLLGSDINIANMIRMLVQRYVDCDDARALKVEAPVDYPEIGVYHPGLKGSISCWAKDLPRADCEFGRIGLLVMRSYVLAGNTAHYDAVIRGFENRGLSVVPIFSSGLDQSSAIRRHLMSDGSARVDALVSLTGFSLVGGPAYNDSQSAAELLSSLDIPYISAQALEFQSIDEWQESERGLLPIETMMMIALPELDGATGTMVYGGRTHTSGKPIEPITERVDQLVSRVERLVRLRKTDNRERKLAIVIYDFPPNSGATGSAAYLSVFSSLLSFLRNLKERGYAVDVPDSVDDLREKVLGGNAAQYGTSANVAHRIHVDTHVQREPHVEEVEAVWGSAPGNIQTDGSSLLVLGEHFGNVFVGVQPGFGYEGDPMRLMFEKGLAPTHAFCAFYSYIKEDFAADAILHFGTHGALEFMPGKQTGLDAGCWPDRLIGSLPNTYLYAANNPSEATIAKRRSQATIVSHLTPAISRAGLFHDLEELKSIVLRSSNPQCDAGERQSCVSVVRSEAARLELYPDKASAWANESQALASIQAEILAVEERLIPCGLHTLGEPPSVTQRLELLSMFAEMHGLEADADLIEQLDSVSGNQEFDPQAAGFSKEVVARHERELRAMAGFAAALKTNCEIDGLIHALEGGYIAPVAGGDVLRNPEILPTGRNIHGFDPSRLPTTYAVAEGAKQARQLLHAAAQDDVLPSTIAMVLWGTDTLKTGGVTVGQALALMGAKPRFDSYGRLAGAELISLEELGRPRIDVLMTISGIFRDLLPKQIQLLAEAAYLCVCSDEPHEQNPIRAHAFAFMAEHNVQLETAALRVFGNAEGAYGANVNHLVDNGRWDDERELGEMFAQRRCFAYGRNGEPVKQAELFSSALANVDMTFQNLDSIELGITSLEHYVDSLGGIGRAVENVRGCVVPTYVGDHTQGRGAIRTLEQQVSLETRSRMLNPRWHDAMLEHGYEGVHQIEHHITNTMGWSATTGQVAPWVYRELSETYLLDEEMRNKLASLNPKASAKLANRLIEAQERNYWSPSESMLAAIEKASEALEDRLEGVVEAQ